MNRQYCQKKYKICLVSIFSVSVVVVIALQRITITNWRNESVEHGPQMSRRLQTLSEPMARKVSPCGQNFIPLSDSSVFSWPEKMCWRHRLRIPCCFFAPILSLNRLIKLVLSNLGPYLVSLVQYQFQLDR